MAEDRTVVESTEETTTTTTEVEVTDTVGEGAVEGPATSEGDEPGEDG